MEKFEVGDLVQSHEDGEASGCYLLVVGKVQSAMALLKVCDNEVEWLADSEFEDLGLQKVQTPDVKRFLGVQAGDYIVEEGSTSMVVARVDDIVLLSHPIEVVSEGRKASAALKKFAEGLPAEINEKLSEVADKITDRAKHHNVTHTARSWVTLEHLMWSGAKIAGGE